jgi:hypothetical protein
LTGPTSWKNHNRSKRERERERGDGWVGTMASTYQNFVIDMSTREEEQLLVVELLEAISSLQRTRGEWGKCRKYQKNTRVLKSLKWPNIQIFFPPPSQP